MLAFAGLSSLVSLACGSSPPAVVAVAPPPVAPVVEPAATEPEGGSEAARRRPACEWKGTEISARDDSLPLCFASDGACFAHTTPAVSGEVTLTLFEGEQAKTAARLRLVSAGIRLDAWTPGEGPVLHPLRPILLGEIAVPQVGPSLRVERLSAGRRLDITLEPIPGIRVLGAALRGRATCADLQLAYRFVHVDEIRAALGLPAALPDERTLVSTAPIPMARAASGAALVEITPEPDERVELLEQQGGQSRISWVRDGAVLLGWVDSAVVGPIAVAPLSAWGTGRGSGSGHPPPGMRCPSSVPLFAEVSGVRGRVGDIEPMTRFDVVARGSPDVTVALRAPHLILEPNAKWLVPADRLTACSVR